MPPRPPVPSVCQIRNQYTVGSKIAENVWNVAFTPAGPTNLAFVDDIALSVDSTLGGLGALWGPDTTYNSTTVTDLSTDTAPVITEGTPTTGSRAGDPLGSNTAVLASYLGLRRYRGGHPRQYLPWFTADDVLTPQTWKTASVADAQTAWAAVVASAVGRTAGGFTSVYIVGVSYVTLGVPRVVPLVEEIGFTVIDSVIASQRRRDGRH